MAPQVVGEGGAAREIPRIAGISSFGAGGANAIGLQERRPRGMHEWDGRACLLTLSARTPGSAAAEIRQCSPSCSARRGRRSAVAGLHVQVGREAMDERTC